MKHTTSLAVAAALTVLFSACSLNADTGQMLGGGIHYLKTVGDIEKDDNFDEDSISYWASFQTPVASMAKLEIDLEFVPDFGGSDEDLLQPQAYLLLGSTIYAAGGIGIGYFDGDWQDEPFYALRAGLDLPLMGGLHIDLNANYRFQDTKVFDTINEDDVDSLTLGAFLRVEL